MWRFVNQLLQIGPQGVIGDQSSDVNCKLDQLRSTGNLPIVRGGLVREMETLSAGVSAGLSAGLSAGIVRGRQ